MEAVDELICVSQSQRGGLDPNEEGIDLKRTTVLIRLWWSRFEDLKELVGGTDKSMLFIPVVVPIERNPFLENSAELAPVIMYNRCLIC